MLFRAFYVLCSSLVNRSMAYATEAIKGVYIAPVAMSNVSKDSVAVRIVRAVNDYLVCNEELGLSNAVESICSYVYILR